MCVCVCVCVCVYIYIYIKANVKQSHNRPGQALMIPGVWGSQISTHSAHEGGEVVSPTHRPPLPSGNISCTHLCQGLSRPQGRSAAGRVMLMKKSNDTIGNRNRDLPACSVVPQSTAPIYIYIYIDIYRCVCVCVCLKITRISSPHKTYLYEIMGQSV